MTHPVIFFANQATVLKGVPINFMMRGLSFDIMDYFVFTMTILCM